MSASLYLRTIYIDRCPKHGPVRLGVDPESVRPLVPVLKDGVTLKGSPAKLGAPLPDHPTHVELPLNDWVLVLGDRFHVGRPKGANGGNGGSANHLIIPHKDVSRTHLILEEQGKGYLLRLCDEKGNLTAKNGTALDNEPLTKDTLIFPEPLTDSGPLLYEVSLAEGTCVLELFVHDPEDVTDTIRGKAITHAGLVLSLSEVIVRTSDKSVDLPRREFLILRALMKSPGVRFPNEELWRISHPGENLPAPTTIVPNVNVIINRLRGLLEKIDPYHDYIVNIRGGYALKKEKREE